MKEKTKLNAAQRLSGLESAITTLDTALYQTMQKLELIQQFLSALNDRQTLMIELLSKNQQVTNESIDALSVEKTTETLKLKVDNLVSEGKLKPAESINNTSFVVTRLVDTEKGSVVTSRIQFVVAAISDEAQKNQFLGKKSGESVRLNEKDTNVYEIQDIYDVVMELEEGDDSAEKGNSEPTVTAQANEGGSEESTAAQ